LEEETKARNKRYTEEVRRLSGELEGWKTKYKRTLAEF
jgi:hypothetical protein